MSSPEYQSQLAHNLTSRTSSQSRFYHFIWLNTFLLLLVLTGSFLWRESQLNAAEQLVAQQLVDDCLQNNNCARITEALETLVQAQKSLKFFNFPRVNLEDANLSQADLYRTNLSYSQLEDANLSQASLYRANLIDANLKGTNLERANLERAFLINTKHLTSSQIKSACNWETAYYQGHFDADYDQWIIDAAANQQFIEQLHLERDSDPQKAVNCRKWE